MTQITIRGLEGALQRALTSIFGVQPATIDPQLLGRQTFAPNTSDYDGYPLDQTIALQESTDNALAITFSTPITTFPVAAPGWSATRVALGTSGTPIQLVGHNQYRRSVRIQNIGAAAPADCSVILAPSKNMTNSAKLTATSGIWLPNLGSAAAGDNDTMCQIEIPTTGEVWAVSATSAATTVLNIIELLEDASTDTW